MKRLPAAQLEAATKRLEKVVKNLPEERRKRVLRDLQNLRALAKLRRIQETAAYERRTTTIADLLKPATKTPRAR